MNIKDKNSRRKLSIVGNGWFIGKISLKFINRHSCSGAILDEDDFEFEEDCEQLSKQYISFSNSLNIILENLDNNNKKVFNFKNLKKLGIYRGKLNPEDLILTNYFNKITKYCNNHWEYEDEEYFLEYQEKWKGIYGEYYFKKGEGIDFEKLDIRVEELDTGYDFYEWVCLINYKDKLRENENIIVGNRKKRLKVQK